MNTTSKKELEEVFNEKINLILKYIETLQVSLLEASVMFQ